MRGVLLLLGLALCAGALLYQAMTLDSGYVLITVGGWALETSLWFALAVLLVVVFAGLVLRYVWHTLMVRGLQGGWRRLQQRRARRSRNKTIKGLLAFIEGHWSQAKRQLEKAAPKAETPLLNYLVAAHAANELGDERHAQLNLSKAEKLAGKDQLAVAITQARMHLNAGRDEKALAAILRCREKAPNHPVVLGLLKDIYFKLSDWQALLGLLPELKAIMPGADYEALSLNVYRGYLRHMVSHEPGAENVDALWRAVPDRLKAELVGEYVDVLEACQRGDEAAQVLRKKLNKRWEKQWINRYGRLQSNDLEARLHQAEQWLNKHPNDAQLLLALGRLSMGIQAWSKARDYLQSALDMGAGREAHLELGRLFNHLEEFELSAQHFQQGLDPDSSLGGAA